MKGHDDKRHDGSIVHVPPRTVLLITSRRSKVDELLTEDDLPADGSLSRWNDYQRFYNPEFADIEHTGKYFLLESEWGSHVVFQRSVICTNAFIEKYLQYRYEPRDICTHLWELFDLIVVDEAHAMVLDATYQSASFYVYELVREYLQRHKDAEMFPEKHKAPRCQNLILMTGSSDPLTNLPAIGEAHILDKMDECINVVPKNIHFTTMREAKASIEQQLQKGERIVYFTNNVILPEAFCKNTSIDPASIAVSFSKKEQRDALSKEHPEHFERMERVETSLAKNSMIPDDVRLWISTSRNKEGINIKNKDFSHLYVESHLMSDIIQMAGRLREGVEHMHVILNSPPHQSNDWEHEAEFCQLELAGSFALSDSIYDGANDYLERLCLQHNITELFNDRYKARLTAYSKGCAPIATYIDFLHDKFPYIRYSYLGNVFRFNQLRAIGFKYQRKHLCIFSNAIDTPHGLQALFRKWFPSAHIDNRIPQQLSTRDEQDAAALQYMIDHGLTNESNRFDLASCRGFLADMNKIYNENLSQLNSLLSRCSPYQLKRVSNTRSNSSYNLFRVCKPAS